MPRSKSSNLGPLNLAVLSICAGVSVGIAAWYWELDRLMWWTKASVIAAIAVSAVWWLSRYRKMTITVRKKHEHWKREWEMSYQSSSGMPRTHKEVMYMITTDKGKAEVSSGFFQAIEEGKRYNVLAQEVDGELHILTLLGRHKA